MCGIIGYIGARNATPILIDGLSKLEYRGYDSAGVAVRTAEGLAVRKKKGRLSQLEEALAKSPVEGHQGIGHTRWATHGEPSDRNAHPHLGPEGKVALVHNGIIENYVELKRKLEAKGYEFRSETDTEVIAYLLEESYAGDLPAALEKTVAQLEGSYALAVMAADNPGEIVVTRKDSPLVVGLGKDGNFIASDIPALLSHTREIIMLEDYEIAVVTRGGVSVMDGCGKPLEKEIFRVTWDVAAAEKGGYAHFMLKEIHEEAKALRDTLSPRMKEGRIDLSELNLDLDLVQNMKRVVIVACGTAYHAGLVAKYTWEKLLRVPVEVDIASEFRYRNPIVGKDDLFIVISQSGETADTLAALRQAKQQGAKVLAITNVVGSTVCREADVAMMTWAGPEIAVASTKAYTSQLMCLYALVLAFARMRGNMEEKEYCGLVAELNAIPGKIAGIMAKEQEIAALARRHAWVRDAYFLGRGLDYAVAMEGSLKLKEISYIHSEAFAAGELKHGTIALIEEGTLVVALCTQSALWDKVASNLKEVKARGAHVLALMPPGAAIIQETADEVFCLPETHDLFAPILEVIPTQLFAYYCSVERGYDVDKPRNLAKSVTVE